MSKLNDWEEKGRKERETDRERQRDRDRDRDKETDTEKETTEARKYGTYRERNMSLPLFSSMPEMEPNGTLNNSNMYCTIENFKQEFYPIIYPIIFIWGVLGNGFSVYIFLQPYKKSTSVNVFMLNLAISDLLFTITLPFRADYYFRGSDWRFGDLACRIMSYSLYVNMYTSIYFLTVLSVVRFLATVHPLQLLHLTSIRSAWILCAVIWAFIMASSSVLLKSGSEKKDNITSCLELNSQKREKLLVMNHIALVVGFLIPFFTLTTCYLLIIRVLLKVEIPELGLRASHRKALTTIVIALIIFLLCFLPYHTLRTLHLVTWHKDSCGDWLHKAVVITLSLAAANCCFNPFLYYFAGENFKDRLKAVLSKEHLQKAKMKFRLPICMWMKTETRL
ncbi:cysteinyl leukotriene receptor 2 isoform X1 [Dipodomys spectabilis]|uniref:cysteinyl leukotriene receptor 2 isoform X1 n=2 Tax=Dipodomys spectabilis TaxID=105255 RepID=UPI001C549A79|nr:cysteinyl leukotriene receptor 2 isoform X1 [Dipodomys spectabilis]